MLLGTFHLTMGLLQLSLDENPSKSKPAVGSLEKATLSLIVLAVFIESSAEIYKAGLPNGIEAYILFTMAEFLWLFLDGT